MWPPFFRGLAAGGNILLIVLPHKLVIKEAKLPPESIEEVKSTAC